MTAYRVATGAQVARFAGINGTYCVAPSPDGKTLMLGTDNGILLLFDAATGRELAHLTVGGCVTTAQWRADGKRILVTHTRGRGRGQRPRRLLVGRDDAAGSATHGHRRCGPRLRLGATGQGRSHGPRPVLQRAGREERRQHAQGRPDPPVADPASATLQSQVAAQDADSLPPSRPPAGARSNRADVPPGAAGGRRGAHPRGGETLAIDTAAADAATSQFAAALLADRDLLTLLAREQADHLALQEVIKTSLASAVTQLQAGVQEIIASATLPAVAVSVSDLHGSMGRLNEREAVLARSSRR